MSEGGASYRRVHFVSDFEEYEPSHVPKVYRCKRCGTHMTGARACYEHRRGFISSCFLNRLKDWYDRNLRRDGNTP